eukprot:SAG11_NODE_24045_length_379_cov_0.550000_1_plen_32_part_01
MFDRCAPRTVTDASCVHGDAGISFVSQFEAVG